MDYGYSNPWGMALQQPMGGLMSPFTPWGLGAINQPVQPQEAMAPRGVKSMDHRESGDTPGYSAPGDPNTAMQTSQATKDRVANSFGGSMAVNAGKAALGSIGAYAAGMPGSMIGQGLMSSMASPGSIGSVIGGGINAALGTQPRGVVGRTLGYAAPVIGGLLGGPFGAMAGGALGGAIGDVVGDIADTREREDVRDDYEGEGFANQVRGRMAYADREGLEQEAAQVRDALPSSAAAIHAMDKAIAATRDLEKSYGISPSYGLDPGKSSLSYGGWGNVGGPRGGVGAIGGYGPSMGGFAGLGIGNPSSYGGGKSSGGSGDKSSGGGYGGHAGGKDGSSTGFGR